jgi:hypothetical protein
MSNKIKIIFLLTILLPVFGLWQNGVSNKEFKDFKNEIEISLRKINNIKTLNDSLIIQNKELRNRLDSITKSAEISVARLNESKSFFDRINLYFTIIATILGVFTILSPIIILTTGILPARKEIKVLKKTVHNFIVSRERESIEFAISQLFAETDKERYEAAFLLSNRIDFKYSNDDIDKIITAHNKIVDSQTKFLIRNILCNQATLEVDKFFREIVKTNDLNYNMYHVLRYLSASKSDFTSEFLRAIEKSDSPWLIYSLMITHSMNTSFSLALEFANNHTLIEYLADKIELKNFKDIEHQILNTAKVNNPESIPDIEKCELIKKTRELEKLEELEKSKIAEENKESEIKKDEKKTVTDTEILEKHDLKLVDGQFIDKKGNVFEPKEIVQTMWGPREVQKMIKLEGRYIDINQIPEGNNEG